MWNYLCLDSRGSIKEARLYCATCDVALHIVTVSESMLIGIRCVRSGCSPLVRLFRKMSSTTKTINKATHPFNRTTLEALLSRRFFYAPAFEIYGGVCRFFQSYEYTTYTSFD